MQRDKKDIFVQLFDHTQSLVALFMPAQEKFIQVNKFGINMFEMRDTDEFVSRFQSMQIWPDPPLDLSASLAEIESTVHVQGYLEEERFYQTATGKTFWGLLRIDSLEINGQKHLLIKITNIDNLKNAALTAVRNAQQLQALFDNSTIGIVITNGEGKIIDFNPFAEQEFGYRKREILGQPVEVLMPDSFRERHKTYRNGFMQNPHDRIMGAGRDLFARRKDGSEFPVEISLNHYRIGEESHVIAFIVDISIRKRNEAVVLRQKEELEKASDQIKGLNLELEKKVEDRTKMLKETLVELEKSKEELRAALEKEKELGELKSRFVTMASHEFRTPLSTILSSSYLAQEYASEADAEKRNKHLAKIQLAVQNLTFILDDFLSLEKLEEGHVRIVPQVMTGTDLVEEIQSVAEEMKNILKKGQRFEIIHTALPQITTDRKLLRNIFINLISNAIKYSPENTPIKIDAVAENGYVKTSVTDEGIGIPEAEQKHLLERFFRATNASSIQGTGLGLHIVGRYLKLIKGDIEIKSELNKGTTVTVLLDTQTVL